MEKAVKGGSYGGLLTPSCSFFLKLLLGIAITALLLYRAAAHNNVHKDGDLTSVLPEAETPRRNLVATKVEVLNSRLEVIKRQIQENQNQVLAYAAHARTLLLGNTKFVRIFTGLAQNFTGLINKSVVLDPETPAANLESLRELDKDVKEQIKAAKEVINEAKEWFSGPQLRIQKMKDRIFSMNEELAKTKKMERSMKLKTAESMPSSLHCLGLRLMQEKLENPDMFVTLTPKPEFEDPSLYHYAIFSDNVLAASVVVNSLVTNAEEPWKHVLHIVTEKTYFEAMQVMLQLKDYRGAHIEVKAVEDYKFLNSSYAVVLRQKESSQMQSFYSRSNSSQDDTDKFRNPKYLSILNHLRFYLPEMYPKLKRVLFLDDDIVVQKDLTGLWEVDMDGKVNGAVYTCFGSFHRYSQYFKFDHPLIKANFDPKACAWAYGMNMFDLDAWRQQKCTEEYHYWQNLNENRTLWKLGTLPPGLATFYSTTKPLDKSWHVLGLGYNPSIRADDIHNAAVVHFNGNFKPWLDIAIKKYRPLWSKYIDLDPQFIEDCNIGINW